MFLTGLNFRSRSFTINVLNFTHLKKGALFKAPFYLITLFFRSRSFTIVNKYKIVHKFYT